MTPLTLRPLTPDDFPVVERLFGPNDAASGCWCMFFHLPTGKEWQATRGEAARQAFAAGAPAIEAYPVVPPKTGKLGAGFAYIGLYEAAGFRKVPNPAGVRPIYRLAP